MNGEQVPAAESHTGRNATLIIAAALVILAVGFIYYWFFARTPVPAPEAAPAVGETAPAAPADLGSELYEKATNPVAGSLPETVAPVPNPVEGIYRNPFE
jgi:flagellar basal body-associated protein FliL